MARSTAYTYGEDGHWKVSSSDDVDTSTEIKEEDKGKDEESASPSLTKEGESNLISTNSDSKSSSGTVEKKYNEIETNILSGTLNFICNKETIKLRAGDTVTLSGFGKYISGKYYVKEVVRQISSNGYSHSATVIKTDFGNSLKMKGGETKKNEKQVKSSPSPKQEPERTYTVKKGDTLWGIAKQFYGNGAEYTKIYDANSGQVANPNLIYPGQIFVIP